MWALTYDYLVNYSMKDMSPEPGLAKSWETSADGLTWTFHVRDGVKWSDGQPLTAADVAYTYTRVLKGETESTNWATYLGSVTSATAPDAQTVVLKLSQPNAVLPLLPIPIVPEHIWKSVSEKAVKTYPAEPKPGQPVVGSGPFRLVEGTAGGSTFRFEKNPDYWNGTPHVDEVDYRVFKAKDPAVQALIKGEVDFVEDIPPLQVKSLQGKPGITAHSGISPLFEEIGFNTGAIDTESGKAIGDGMPALKDPKFRHALGYAVDTKRIVQNAYQGAALPGDTIIPTAYDNYHWDVPADQAFTFDLAKAGEQLDAAGYKKGADGQRTDPQGKPLTTMRLFARSSDPASVNTMDFFKEWLGQIGIKADVTAMDSSKLGDVILSGEYDAFQWDWYVEPDPDSILSDFTCDQLGGSSDSWYCNKEYDAMYKQQNGEMDHAKRVDLVKKMQELLFQESPYIVTAYTTIGEAVRSDRFACFQPQPDPGGVWLIQYGAHNYSSLRPASEAGDCDGVTSALGANASSGEEDAAGTNTAVWIGIGVVVVLLLVGGGVLALRRRGTEGERE
ncbi:ABC transporter substrate-binding protein [Angustibacter luteus]|uniref:ABC transporter substrate-binding protein n=1 Tax=Angustibacter luteus TaxID=658456 RepID=A0ABW1JE45_9ACTN